GNVPVLTREGRDITSENITDVYDDYFPDQNTQLEVYQQIERDLLEALEYAPTNDPANKTRFTKSVVRALLAKVYAEQPMRDYAKVVQYADQLTADGFALEPDFTNLFGMNSNNTDAKMRNTRESILEAQFFAGNGNWVTWMLGRDLSNYNNQFAWAKWITPSRDLIRV
ncbi:RagB/SusD family nutrient uptake outer membrane protein, partial [Brucella sp. 21LCYQ03]|nr:RagB/SusD family nutrient uptake outer membrane protein [Brucella sp. 21LCYQ03]